MQVSDWGHGLTNGAGRDEIATQGKGAQPVQGTNAMTPRGWAPRCHPLVSESQWKTKKANCAAVRLRFRQFAPEQVAGAMATLKIESVAVSLPSRQQFCAPGVVRAQKIDSRGRHTGSQLQLLSIPPLSLLRLFRTAGNDSASLARNAEKANNLCSGKFYG